MPSRPWQVWHWERIPPFGFGIAGRSSSRHNQRRPDCGQRRSDENPNSTALRIGGPVFALSNGT
jgi:hypothetical protein